MSQIIKSLKQAVSYARGDKTAGRSTIILEMHRSSADRINQLVTDTVARDAAEVVSNALRLYEACVKELSLGSRVIIHRLDGTEENVFSGDLWE